MSSPGSPKASVLSDWNLGLVASAVGTELAGHFIECPLIWARQMFVRD